MPCFFLEMATFPASVHKIKYRIVKIFEKGLTFQHRCSNIFDIEKGKTIAR